MNTYMIKGSPIYPVGYEIPAAIEYINEAVAVIKREKLLGLVYPERVNIWCMGSSGAILAALLHVKLDYPDIKIRHVKKQGESAHSSSHYAVYPENEYHIVIDDFISSGETLSNIWRYMNENYKATKIDLLIIGAGHRLERDSLKELPIDRLITNTQS